MPRLLVVLLCVALCSEVAGAPSIDLFFDLDCTTCSADVQLGVPFTLYIQARLEGSAQQGITGADFRVDGMPAAWLVLSVAPNPLANLNFGNPLAGGATIAFPSCAGDSSQCLNLYTCTIVPTSVVASRTLTVRGHPTPVDCHGPCCPYLLLCDPPLYTQVCVLGGQAILNGPPCTVNVERQTWSRFKSLYR